VRRPAIAAGVAFALVCLVLVAGAEPALAQTFTLDLGGEGGSTTGRIVQLFALLTVLSLAPAILVMVTSFTRIVVVLSFMRTAMGLQQTPPNMVLVSLALFLTAFIMAPTLETAYREGIEPLIAEEISEAEAMDRTIEPIRGFMMRHVREQDLALFLGIAAIAPAAGDGASGGATGGATSDGAPEQIAQAPAGPDAAPLRALVPAFMISELRRAFEIGFLLFVPFLIIDMVVASILMSMGMLMLPPVLISLPFKLIFFVLVDGWYLVAGSLVESFGGA